METNEQNIQEPTGTDVVTIDTTAPATPIPEEGAEQTLSAAELQRELAAAKKAKDAAEKALSLEKSAHSKLKREHMSDAEVLAEQKAEIAEKAKMYDRQVNAITAERIFINAGLSGDSCEDLLNLIVNEDAQRTESTAQAIVDLLSTQTRTVEKSVREKVLRETPHPPAGDKETVDQFLEGFNKPY